MAIVSNGRVNIVITNQVLRYAYHKNPSLDGLVDRGEVTLPKDTLKDGTIINKAVLVEILSDLVKTKKWKRKRVYFCLPDDSIVIRQLTIPATLSKEEALSYMQTQIGHSFYLPFDQPALAIEFLELEKEERQILLYAYPKGKIEAFEEVMEEVGLNPVVADLTTLSVYRYYYREQKEEDKNHILHIHWNRGALILTAYYKDKAVFTRYIKVSTSDNLEELDVEAVDHIVREYLIEINRIIDFYQFSISKEQASVELLLLSGDFPYLSIVRKALTDSISITIHTFADTAEEIKFIDVLGLGIKQKA